MTLFNRKTEEFSRQKVKKFSFSFGALTFDYAFSVLSAGCTSRDFELDPLPLGKTGEGPPVLRYELTTKTNQLCITDKSQDSLKKYIKISKRHTASKP